MTNNLKQIFTDSFIRGQSAKFLQYYRSLIKKTTLKEAIILFKPYQQDLMESLKDESIFKPVENPEANWHIIQQIKRRVNDIKSAIYCTLDTYETVPWRDYSKQVLENDPFWHVQ